jgi:hypothetical protein
VNHSIGQGLRNKEWKIVPNVLNYNDISNYEKNELKQLKGFILCQRVNNVPTVTCTGNLYTSFRLSRKGKLHPQFHENLRILWNVRIFLTFSKSIRNVGDVNVWLTRLRRLERKPDVHHRDHTTNYYFIVFLLNVFYRVWCEVRFAATIKNVNLWDIMPHSSDCRLHIACYLLGLLFGPEDEVPPKCQRTYIRLHGVTSQ